MKPSEIQEIMNDDILSEEEKLELILIFFMLAFKNKIRTLKRIK